MKLNRDQVQTQMLLWRAIAAHTYIVLDHLEKNDPDYKETLDRYNQACSKIDQLAAQTLYGLTTQ